MKWTCDPEEGDMGVLSNHEGHEVAMLSWDEARDIERHVNLSLDAQREALKKAVMAFCDRKMHRGWHPELAKLFEEAR